MTTTMLVFVAGAISCSLLVLAWYAGYRSGLSARAAAELPQAMRRIVDMESVDRAQAMRKAEMVAARRTSVPRAKSVGSAKIRKVSFRRP